MLGEKEKKERTSSSISPSLISVTISMVMSSASQKPSLKPSSVATAVLVPTVFTCPARPLNMSKLSSSKEFDLNLSESRGDVWERTAPLEGVFAGVDLGVAPFFKGVDPLLWLTFEGVV